LGGNRSVTPFFDGNQSRVYQLFKQLRLTSLPTGYDLQIFIPLTNMSWRNSPKGTADICLSNVRLSEVEA